VLSISVFLKCGNIALRHKNKLVRSVNTEIFHLRKCTEIHSKTVEDSRRFVNVVKGSIKMKMTSKKYTKYLDEIKDYENIEFSSRVNVRNVEGLSG
jgi:hypothetical protein